MDKISVIVPAYNCQDTIEKCINSIQNQTYKNLEIIVVNDGSTDNTAEVIKSLQDEDERIKVFSIPNGGVSHARNIGIDNSTGDYITFVDSDDYIDEEMYDTLHLLANEYGALIAHCSYKNVFGEVIKNVGGSGKVSIIYHDDGLRCLISGKLFGGGIWNKLYHKNLFCNIRFDENIIVNEDILINYFLFDSAEKSVYIDKCFYSYVSNEKSATHSVSSVAILENVVTVSKIINDKSYGKAYCYEAEQKLAYSLLILYKAYCFNNVDKVKKSILRQTIIDNKNVYTRRNDKISYFLLLYTPHVYKLLNKVYQRIRKEKLDPKQ